MNQFLESHHELWLLLKLQVRPTRWVGLIEAMAIGHFIGGAHKCLINEFPHTRVGPFERFFCWHMLNAPKAVAGDKDLQQAIEKIETKYLKRLLKRVLQFNHDSHIDKEGIRLLRDQQQF